MAGQVWFRGENGMLNVFDEPLPAGIRHRLDRGDLVRVNPDGTPWADGQEPDGGDEGLPDGAPPLPKRSASQKVWADFAVSQGMDRDKAAAMKRDELVEEFTKLRAVS